MGHPLVPTEGCVWTLREIISVVASEISLEEIAKLTVSTNQNLYFYCATTRRTKFDFSISTFFLFLQLLNQQRLLLLLRLSLLPTGWGLESF